MKKTIAVILTLSVMLGIIFQIALAKEFSDMPASHWAFQYVDKLSNEGVINGYEDGSFRPSKEVTRAEFIKLITCVVSSGDEWKNPFYELRKPASNKWYKEYVEFAELAGLLPRHYSDLELTSSMLRFEMTEVIYQACKYKGLIVEEPNANVPPDFDETIVKTALELKYVSGDNLTSDKVKEMLSDDEKKLNEVMGKTIEKMAKFGEYEIKFDDSKDLDRTMILHINEVSGLGLIKGYEDGSFRPFNSLTRAEVATMIYRVMALVGGEQ